MFTLAKQSDTYWDKVIIPVRTEGGRWQDLTLDVQFRRWGRKQLDEHLEVLREQDEGRDGPPSLEEQAERVLAYLADWKVKAADSEQRVELTPETLASVLDAIPASGRCILDRFISSTYGVREKN